MNKTVQSQPEEANRRAVALLRGSVPSSNVFETTVERLRRSIKLGLFRPGQQIPTERELTELIGVSRTTVRSAIKVLVTAGFLEVRRGRSGGTFVSETPPIQKDESSDYGHSAEEINQFFDRRLVVEAGIVALATQRISQTNLATLRQLVGAMAEQVGDRNRFRETDVQFHIALAEATENDWLIQQAAEIQAILGELIEMIPPSEEALTNSNMQHAKIVSFLAKTEPDNAREAMAEHVAGSVRFLHGLLPEE